MASVWDKFSDPVSAPPVDEPSWDDFSDPVQQRPSGGWREVRGTGGNAAPIDRNAPVPDYAAMFAPKSRLAEAGGVLDAGATMVANTIPQITGSAAAVIAPFVGGDSVAAEQRFGVQGWGAQPMTAAGRYAQQVIADNASSLFAPLTRAVKKVDDVTGMPFGEALRHTLTLAPVVPAARAVAPGVAVARQVAGKASRMAAQTTGKAFKSVTTQAELPTLTELRNAKNAAYKAADESGVVISRGALNRLKTELVNDLKKEGIDKALHPKSVAAVNRILESKGQLSLSEIETLRKIANDAKGAIEKADARLGAHIVDKIDDFEANLSASDVVGGSHDSATVYRAARALNTKLSKAEQIQNLFHRAELNAPNFSGSGMENALRTEFRALAKDQRKMRRFSAEEQAAIKKVALGGPVENSLRQLGKLAPTGVVSAGMGTMAGFAVGGPAGAASVPAIGLASRAAATRMTMKNALNAEKLMRTGKNK